MMVKLLACLITVLFALPVAAQDAATVHTPSPACTEEQVRYTANIAVEILSRLEETMQSTTIADYDTLHTAYWNTFMPGLPSCAYAQHVALALTNVVDEVYLTALLHQSGINDL